MNLKPPPHRPPGHSSWHPFHRFVRHSIQFSGFLWTGLVLAAPAKFLSEHPERLVASTQSWGALGLDTAAHQADRPGDPLRIGGQSFARGLGHHANGAIQVLLDGEFTTFDAWVGLQPCGAGGSVVFRVVVDGEPRFESGVMRDGDAPRAVRVDVAGAQELRLEAADAGDGIACDMANWAEARLTPSDTAGKPPAETPLDVAPFGRIVTWDPNRLDGVRASRIEEFPAADLFIETDLTPDTESRFAVVATTNGLACVGVQWLNRRAVKDLALTFADPRQMPATNEIRVEGWFGESAWQGRWLPLDGELSRSADRLGFRASAGSPVGGLLLTRKVRWVWPTKERVTQVRRPAVFTRSRWATASLLVQFERPARMPEGHDDALKAPADELITVQNGAWVGEPRLVWDATQPQPFQIRYSRASSLKSDPTLLILSRPWDRVAVAVQDVLDHDAVYLPTFGALFCRADKPVTLAEYKARIAGSQTILEQVRKLPDQTFAQAMARTHHEAQREGPVMLSLAGDNTKVVVERDGTVRFRTTPHTGTDWSASVGELRFRFEGSPAERVTRNLEGGWLPVPVITREHRGVTLRQRTFVAPADEPGDLPARLNRRSVCVVEFAVEAARPEQVVPPLRVAFAPPKEDHPWVLEAAAPGWLLKRAGQPVALVRRVGDGGARPAVSGTSLVFEPALFANGARWAAYLLPPDFPPDQLSGLPDPDRLCAATAAYWRAVLAPATQIETPEPFVNDLIRSSQVRCLIAARNEADGARVAAWIAAMSYGPLESEAHAVIRGMDFLGHHDFARRGLEYFIHRYNSQGFLTTGYTTFGTAWHLWTLGEHVQLTRDTNWLARVAPELKRVGRWIMAQTAKTDDRLGSGPVKAVAAPGQPAPPRGRFLDPGRVSARGLMPPGVMADWNAFAFHFCLNGYYAAALRHVGDALTGLGDPEGRGFTDAGARLGAATARSFERTRAASPAVRLRNGTWVPYYPSQVHSPGMLGGFFPGEDAGRSWCYDVELGAHQLVPTGVLDPADAAVSSMLDHMEDVQFLADGWFDYAAADNKRDWFNLGGFSKVQPYYTRNAEIYALRDDVKPFVRSYFNTLAAMVNPEVMTFWEHFNHSGAWDKTHETGYFLHQTRLMLVQERGPDLWLAPMITSNWLRDGLSVAVTNAPTRFGPVSFRLESHVAQGRIEATIEPPAAGACRQVVLRLRHPADRRIGRITVNGVSHEDFDAAEGTIRLPSNRGRSQVVAVFEAGGNAP